ncbi:MAG: endonuclease/exonuclease/phosphatase family protein [Acidobacteriota bacterium]
MGEAAAVKVLTFNIRYGTAPDGDNAWPLRRRLVVGILEAELWDFVGLQEALRFQIAELTEALPQFAWIGKGRDRGDQHGEHVPILFRAERWRLLAEEHFWLSDTPEVPGSRSWGNRLPRMVTAGHFEEEGTGRRLWVFNTHFDHQSQVSRERSARLLADRIARRKPADPVVLLGDFNAGESNPAVRFLRGADPESPVALLDSFRVVFPDATEVGTFHGFRGGSQGEKIDYVFVDPEVKVVSAAILRTAEGERYPSDHYPVAATLELP